MTQQSYLNTLLNVIDHHDYYKAADYTDALEYLFNKPFTPMYSDDMNRLDDAVDFRIRHGFRNKDIPISILEMMVSLAVRIETTIMLDGRKGDRTSEWFWNMFDSLGFTNMHNGKFDSKEAWYICNKFASNNYSRDGSGGLFTLKTHHDMAKKTIWQQAMAWLNHYE